MFLLTIFSLFAFGARAQVGDIKVRDQPFGYSSIDVALNFSRYAGKESKVTIKNRQSLIKYAKIVGYVIYIDSFIKLSRGKIPQNGNSLLGLDKFISKIGGGEFNSYAKFMQA